MENIEKNQTYTVKAVLGDVKNIENQHCEIIFANINRNILLQDMHLYAQSLTENGILLLSGFYLHPDLPIVEEVAKKYNFIMDSYKEQDNWVAVRFKK